MFNIIIWVISTLTLITGGTYLVSKTDFGKDVGLDKVFEFKDDNIISDKTTADDKILEDSLKMKDNKTFSNLKEEEKVLIERLKSLDKKYDEVVKRFLKAYQKNFELKNKLSQNLEKTLTCANIDGKKISSEFLRKQIQQKIKPDFKNDFKKESIKTKIKNQNNIKQDKLKKPEPIIKNTTTTEKKETVKPIDDENNISEKKDNKMNPF